MTKCIKIYRFISEGMFWPFSPCVHMSKIVFFIDISTQYEFDPREEI